MSIGLVPPIIHPVLRQKLEHILGKNLPLQKSSDDKDLPVEK